MAPREVLVVRLDSGPELGLLADGAGGTAIASIWPGVGAESRSMVVLRLSEGASTVALRHAGEAVYYVRSGCGAVHGEGSGGGAGTTGELGEGAIVHVGAATTYHFAAGTDGGGLDLVGGPCPPDPSWYAGLDGKVPGLDDAPGPERDVAAPPGAPEAVRSSGIQVLSRDEPALMLPVISSDARMIAWPGNGAWDATMNYVRMAPGEENRPHAHPDSEDTIVILEGRGAVDDLSAGRTLEFSAGDVIHVPARVRHAVRANRGSPVVSVGGPCPADVGFLRACGAELPDRELR